MQFTPRRAGFAALLAVLVVYYSVAEALPGISLWSEVAFLGVVLIPAVFALVWFVLPLWHATGLFPVGAAFGALAVAAEIAGLDVLADFAKLAALTLIAFWFLSLFEALSWVTLVALIIPLVDIFSVFRGPTGHVLEERPGIFETIAFGFPVPGQSVPARIGPPDVLFFALFLAAAARFNLRVAWTWLGLAASFGLTLALAVWLDLGGLPALPLLSLGFLLPNADLLWRDVRRVLREDRRGMSGAFAVAGDAYDRFMGRYSRELAPKLIEFAGVEPGMRVLDVGCGPGALAERLAALVGSEHLGAADPSEPFVEACAERLPGADVRRAEAEELPWEEEAFDAALAQLVVNFMKDAEAGVSEMRRVVRRGGVVGACTWDYDGEMQMLRAFWDAARAVDPHAPDEGSMPFTRPAELERLWREVGLNDVETRALVVEMTYSDFDDFWEPFTLGVGPAGSYCQSLEPEQREALRKDLFNRLGSPEGQFTLNARAWAVRGLR